MILRGTASMVASSTRGGRRHDPHPFLEDLERCGGHRLLFDPIGPCLVGLHRVGGVRRHPDLTRNGAELGNDGRVRRRSGEIRDSGAFAQLQVCERTSYHLFGRIAVEK